MDKVIKFKHWVNKKRTAVKLSASVVGSIIRLDVWEGREQYGKTTYMEMGEALLLADWIRETALAILREETKMVVEPRPW